MRKDLSWTPLLRAAILFVGLLILSTVARLLFWGFNAEYFTRVPFHAFVAGMRFDISALCLLNIPCLLLYLLPFSFARSRVASRIGGAYFLIANSVALFADLVDVCYYPFSMRRMTGDIFGFVAETNNWGDLLPVFLRDYYYMVLIAAAFVVALVLMILYVGRLELWRGKESRGLNWAGAIARIVVVAAVVAGMRGGLQYRPLNVASAANVAGVENAPLVLNTPFSLMTTWGDRGVERCHYLDEVTAASCFSTSGKKSDPGDLTAPATENVVLIILEGISSEYSDYLADEPKTMAGFTPFLDSLARRSIVFRGYANGRQSIEALSSILGGIPSLMSVPFSQSQYAASRFDYAFPKLEARGMRTAFFHGGKNGTMGFDRYCALAGVKEYYGLNEYPNAGRDYDGTWGIADLPYLQYVSRTLDAFESPFFATVFTLSSHHPFRVPAAYDRELPKGKIPMQHSVAYTDLALKEFFATASKSEWFEKTLFVITADHTNFKDADCIDYQRHRYAVPVIFFHPKGKAEDRRETIVQQVDLMPTIFAYCGWSEPFQSFGGSAFDDVAPHYALNCLSGTYQMYMDGFLIEFDGRMVTAAWDLSLPAEHRSVELSQVAELDEYERLLKAVIQKYNNGLLDNNL